MVKRFYLPLRGQREPGSNGNEGVLNIPQSSSITRASPSDCVVSYPGHLWKGSLISLPRCNLHIKRLQPTGSQDTRWVSPILCRDAISVFYSANRQGHRILVGGILSSAEMQSANSSAPADCATGHSLRESYPPQRCNQCILQPQRQGHRTLVGGVLSLCRDAISVFYSPNRQGHRTLVGGGPVPLQRCNQRILQPQPTGSQDTRWGSPILCRDAISEFFSPNRLCHRTLVKGVLSLFRDAISVFYNPSRLCHRIFVGGESYPSAEMQSAYSTARTDWVTGLSLGESCPSAEMQSAYCTALTDWDSLKIINIEQECMKLYNCVQIICFRLKYLISVRQRNLTIQLHNQCKYKRVMYAIPGPQSVKLPKTG